MSTVTFIQPDATSQQPAAYKDAIDASMQVVAGGLGSHFGVHQRTDVTPNMTVRVDAGRMLTGTLEAGTLEVVTIAAQNSGTITAPVSNPRYDLVYLTPAGVVGITTGTENASPSIPKLAANQIPLAAILLQTSSTQIFNSMISDLRVPYWNGGNNATGNLYVGGGIA
jgi:hypothetical protein